MQDNLPGTGIESHACGTPVIGFNIGGLPDIITDKVTGALVSPFDTDSLADKIKWAIEDDERNFILGKNASKKANKLWGQEIIAKQYIEFYSEIHSHKQKSLK